MENKLNSGAIFKNDKKTKDTHPDYRGKVNVNGKEMEVALWVKQGKNGSFMSASFSEPYVPPTTSNVMSSAPISQVDNDDFPF